MSRKQTHFADSECSLITSVIDYDLILIIRSLYQARDVPFPHFLFIYKLTEQTGGIYFHTDVKLDILNAVKDQ